MGIIITGILVCVYVSAPLPIQLLMLAVNVILPDSIFAIDEIIMVASTIKKISQAGRIVEVVSENKVLSIIIGIVVALLIVWIFWL